MSCDYWKKKYERVLRELQQYDAANNLLYERIHKDLNPRIKRLTTRNKELTCKVHEAKGLFERNENQRFTIETLQARQRELIAQADKNYFAKQSADILLEGMTAKDARQQRVIDGLQAQLDRVREFVEAQL